MMCSATNEQVQDCEKVSVHGLSEALNQLSLKLSY